MFDGFQLDRVETGEVTLRVGYGGRGEPVSRPGLLGHQCV